MRIFSRLFNHKTKASSISTKANETTMQGTTLVFRKNTITYHKHTLMLKNITQFKHYEAKRRVSVFLFILSIFIASVLILTLLGSDLLNSKNDETTQTIILSIFSILLFIFGRLIVIGADERSGPRMQGLTIELNSGYHYNFLSRDIEGINQILKVITDSAEKDEPINQTFHIEGDRVINTGPVEKQVNFAEVKGDINS